MVIYQSSILLFSTIICPTVAEVLTQSFVIRLKEIAQLKQDQKQVIEDFRQITEDQRKLIDTLTSGKVNTCGEEFIYVSLELRV